MHSPKQDFVGNYVFVIFFFYYPEYVSVSETLEFYRNEPGIASKFRKRDSNFARLTKSTFGFFFLLRIILSSFLYTFWI